MGCCFVRPNQGSRLIFCLGGSKSSFWVLDVWCGKLKLRALEPSTLQAFDHEALKTNAQSYHEFSKPQYPKHENVKPQKQKPQKLKVFSAYICEHLSGWFMAQIWMLLVERRKHWFYKCNVQLARRTSKTCDPEILANLTGHEILLSTLGARSGRTRARLGHARGAFGARKR